MDIDARWVKKRGERFYGYKDNVEICSKTKLIRNYTVCSASRHDSKETEHVLTEPPKEAHGEPAWLDAGYAGMEDVVKAKHMTPIICEKGRRGHPLTGEQKERNLVSLVYGRDSVEQIISSKKMKYNWNNETYALITLSANGDAELSLP